MPTYAFRCEACEHEFTIETSYSRKSESRCPECGGDQLKELFGRYSLTVTGTGRNGGQGGTGGGDASSGPACSPFGGG